MTKQSVRCVEAGTLYIVTMGKDERYDVFFVDGGMRGKPAVYSCWDASLLKRSSAQAKKILDVLAKHLVASWQK